MKKVTLFSQKNSFAENLAPGQKTDKTGYNHRPIFTRGRQVLGCSRSQQHHVRSQKKNRCLPIETLGQKRAVKIAGEMRLVIGKSITNKTTITGERCLVQKRQQRYGRPSCVSETEFSASPSYLEGAFHFYVRETSDLRAKTSCRSVIIRAPFSVAADGTAAAAATKNSHA